MALVFLPSLLLYKKNKKVCFFAASIHTLGTLILDMILSAFSMAVYGYYPTKILPHTWSSVSITLLIDVMYYCAFAPIIIIWRKKTKKYSTKSMKLFMLFPVGQALFTAACTYPTWKIGATFKVFDNPFIPIALVTSVVSDILMFIALRDNNNLEAAKARAALAESEMEHQLQYYSELTEKMTEIREYRHDINNLVSVAEALITENSSQNSKNFIEDIKHKAEGMKIPVYLSNEIANAVLWKKEQEARLSGVEFKVKTDIDETFPLDKIDVCSLLANLLDNAVNEAKETEDKIMEITVGRKYGLLMIEVVNSTAGNLNIAEKKPKSNKSGDHGHGMEIVEKIAEKYKGGFVFEVKEGKARATVSLTV